MTPTTNPNQFTELRAEPLQSTLDRLQRRIDERFVGSGLGQVARGLRALSDDVVTLADRLRRPVWALRIPAGAAALALLVVTALVIASAAHRDAGFSGGFGLLQATETAVNELILLSIALLLSTHPLSRLLLRATGPHQQAGRSPRPRL